MKLRPLKGVPVSVCVMPALGVDVDVDVDVDGLKTV